MSAKLKSKKIGIWIAGLAFLLVTVLTIHIYFVTRPQLPGVGTIAMARIDIKQKIDEGDAARITKWLYGQKGVDHVLCNPCSQIVVFTYRPVKVAADQVVKNFQASLPYRAERYVLTAADLKNGCPAMSGSWGDRLYSLVKQII